MSFEKATELVYPLLDKGLIPDFITRRAIRQLLSQRIYELNNGSLSANHAAKMAWIEKARTRVKIADHTDAANKQHYEVSTNFILSCLGPYAKYSSCYYPTGKETLEEAEVAMLEMYCKNAQLRDGQAVLDLGCGWGSLTLYLAKRYPNSQITAISNSATQRAYIEGRAKEQDLPNVEVITGDVNVFEFPEPKYFDRILSIEMFEHMKNYQKLLSKVSSWLRRDVPAEEALLFIHVFCHRSQPYDFEDNDGWMASMFFSGGTMPSHDLLLYFQDDISIVRSWWINGQHYARTLEDWLKKQDSLREKGLPELELDAEAKGAGKEEGTKTFYRFRVFYMACAELFAYNGGEEWGVGHYLFKRKD